MSTIADLGQDTLGFCHEYLKWQYQHKQFDLGKSTPEAEKEQARVFRKLMKRVVEDKYLKPEVFKPEIV